MRLLAALGIANRPRLHRPARPQREAARRRARRARPRPGPAGAVGCRHADGQRPGLRARRRRGEGGRHRHRHSRAERRADRARGRRGCRPTASRSRGSSRASRASAAARSAPLPASPARWSSSSRPPGSRHPSPTWRGAFGADRPAAVCRELTKLHEEVARGTLAELAEWAAPGVRGEVVVVVGGSGRRATSRSRTRSRRC